MASLSPPALAAAVSEAGALGTLGLGRPGVTVHSAGQALDWIEAHTSNPFGANFVLAPHVGLDREVVKLAARRARVIEFFYNMPDSGLVRLVHDQGALAAWQVGSLAEAVTANEAGCDFIVAQGIEAGGHVRGKIGVFELLAQVLPEVDVPVLAAGGFGTGQSIAAALEAGADGVRLGTRFLAAREADAHPEYVAALIAARTEDSVYTTKFSVGWGAPVRALASCLEAAESAHEEVIGERSGLDGTRLPVRRFQPIAVDRSVVGNIPAMSLYAGTGVGAIARLQSVAKIVEELAEGAGWEAPV